ncbi:peptidase dimerization domain-containing protein [Dictyobacter kobayashii]|uniref:Uncharacterized protein n=1 Tax=Dictyobacter kobayashii TaxID=2014872 RepID=A0A402AEG4_9CHLR|nr:peptidase dimerization domain-containing protein [Dictyobacter kobayashii]GCE17474.1 hypothetical protein KDK_12740 [Dictyobacter kobayashii]
MALSTVQRLLLQTINDQSPLYLEDWQAISTQIYTSPAQKIQDIWLALLRHYGFLTQYLDPDQFVLYGEYIAQAPQTLLFYVKYTPSMAVQQVAFPLLSQLAAMHAYCKHFNQLPVNIKWLIDCQPSRSSDDLERLLTEQRSLLQADGCILYTTKHEISKVATQTELLLGRKGHLLAEVSLQTATRPIPASYGAIAPDAAWQLVWALAALKDSREDILLTGFYDHVRSPEDEAIEAISHLPDTHSDLIRSWGTERLLMDLEGIQQHYAHFLTPTCTITLLSSPTAEQHTNTVDPISDSGRDDFIPAQARARLDLRLVPDQDPYEIFTQLQQHFHTHMSYPVQCDLISASLPAAISVREPLVQRLQQAISAVAPQAPLLLPLTADHSAYSLLANQLGVPTIGIVTPLAVQSSTAINHPQLLESIKQNVLLLFSYKGLTSNLSSH